MHTSVIGQVAGKVWKSLGARGRVALTTLPKLLEVEAPTVQQAVGWLARENKVVFEKQGRAVYVRLSTPENEVYHRGNTA